MGKLAGWVAAGVIALTVTLCIVDKVHTEKHSRKHGNEDISLTIFNDPLLLGLTGQKGRNYLDIIREDDSKITYSDYNGDHKIDRVFILSLDKGGDVSRRNFNWEKNPNFMKRAQEDYEWYLKLFN